MIYENFCVILRQFSKNCRGLFINSSKSCKLFLQKAYCIVVCFIQSQLKNATQKGSKKCSAVFDDTFVQYQNETRSDSYMLSLLLFLFKRFRSCPQLRMNGQSLETLKVFDSFSIVLEELCSTLAPE